MQLLKQMLPSAALGAAVAAALLFVFVFRWKSASRCAAAIAIGAGYIAGHVLAAGWAPFSPRSATHWLFWFAIIGVIAATIDALGPAGVAWDAAALHAGGPPPLGPDDAGGLQCRHSDYFLRQQMAPVVQIAGRHAFHSR